MSRNKKYEDKMKSLGFRKVTIWVPQDRESDVKQAASVICEHENLTVGVLKDVNTGRIVSMHD